MSFMIIWFWYLIIMLRVFNFFYIIWLLNVIGFWFLYDCKFDNLGIGLLILFLKWKCINFFLVMYIYLDWYVNIFFVL